MCSKHKFTLYVYLSCCLYYICYFIHFFLPHSIFSFFFGVVFRLFSGFAPHLKQNIDEKVSPRKMCETEGLLTFWFWFEMNAKDVTRILLWHSIKTSFGIELNAKNAFSLWKLKKICGRGVDIKVFFQTLNSQWKLKNKKCLSVSKHSTRDCKLWNAPWLIFFLSIFTHNSQLFMSEALYLHQTFTD